MEEFTNGSAFLCIDTSGGCISRIDVELDNPIGLVNSSAEQFLRSFAILDDMLVRENWEPEEAASKLVAIDGEAYEAGSEWRMLIDYLMEKD